MSKINKKLLDDWFSRYIRLRGAKDGYNRCYTCGKIEEPKNLQCGHYVSRIYTPVRWEEDNCRPQCVYCNMFSEGKKPTFAMKLSKEKGAKWLDMLEIKKNNIIKMDKFAYQLLINAYQSKVVNLLKEKNIKKWW